MNAPPSNPRAALYIASLLRIARDDLQGARILARASNRNAIYCCEQAAEKIIRAILTSEGLHAGASHRLAEMVDQLPDLNPLKERLRCLEELEAYATSFRYPTAAGRIALAPSPEVFERYAAQTEEALREAVERLGVELDANTPAHRPRPMRG